MLPNRYWPFASCLLLTLLASVAALYLPLAGWGVVAFGALSLVGLWDLLQRKHTLRRNYPLTAHFRYGLESIGPEIRQYFIESDTHEAPFSRLQRAIADLGGRHAEGASDRRPWLDHGLWVSALPPLAPGATHQYRFPVGAPGTHQGIHRALRTQRAAQFVLVALVVAAPAARLVAHALVEHGDHVGTLRRRQQQMGHIGRLAAGIGLAQHHQQRPSGPPGRCARRQPPWCDQANT